MFNLLIKNLIDNLYEIKFKVDLGKSLRDYVNKLYYRLKITKTLIFRNEPLDFYKNYIPLTLSGGKEVIRVDDPSKLLTNYPKIGVVGSAGSGKTTLLKYIALNALETEAYIPIFIELRNFDFSYESFEHFILFNVSKNNDLNRDLVKLFETNKFLFIFDGFDEIDYLEGNNLISQIDLFISNYSNNKFIISSRPGTNLESITPLHIFNVAPLNENDIYLFIDNLNINSILKRKIHNSIENDKLLTEILNIPLFLSLYITSYSTINYENYNKKSIFFRNIVDSLFSQHDSITKLGYVREKVSDLNKEELEKITAALAFRTYFATKFVLSKDELYKEFDIIKKTYDYTFENTKLLFDLTITVNILIDYDNHFVFPHILIMEYLSAIFISNLEYTHKLKFYQQVSNSSNISFSSTFLEFLFELDYIFFNKNLLLPILERFLYDYNDIYKNKKNNGLLNFLRTKYNLEDFDRVTLQSLKLHLEKEFNNTDINNDFFNIF